MWLIKMIIARERPIDPIPFIIESSSSFPSAHAALIAALSGFLLYLILRHSKWPQSAFHKSLHALFFLIIIIIVGFSRLYLGVHYPLDIIAGGVLGWGIGWLSLCIRKS